MTFSLEFQKKQTYNSLETGITIDAVLRYGSSEVTCLAKADTGSEVCLFERGVAEALGIEVESGYQRIFSTLTGHFIAFGHEVELETLGLRLQSFVYFPELFEIRRNLLGRQGWLQLLKFALVDYESTIYLSPLGG